eukprot:TRINITY_DN65615_c0_g1_i6.p2 TRINITY_DN65615_c0_g1~~TRINITY_DN65615_c0_g1_i6.p2  ORF type:complete len:123 (-),score=14.95 TRINITY_DN65615_c0_g1_i6:279-647(-)
MVSSVHSVRWLYYRHNGQGVILLSLDLFVVCVQIATPRHHTYQRARRRQHHIIFALRVTRQPSNENESKPHRNTFGISTGTEQARASTSRSSSASCTLIDLSRHHRQVSPTHPLTICYGRVM